MGGGGSTSSATLGGDAGVSVTMTCGEGTGGCEGSTADCKGEVAGGCEVCGALGRGEVDSCSEF